MSFNIFSGFVALFFGHMKVDKLFTKTPFSDYDCRLLSRYLR